MLSRTSKEEIIRKLEIKVGHPISEGQLSPGTRRAITTLSIIQRHLYMISEILNGEQGRIEHSAILSLTSRVRRDKEIEAHVKEVSTHQKELETKISEISAQIVEEDRARMAGQPLPEREGGVEAVELKCPRCGAALPMPTSRFVKCQYCDATISIQDVGQQIKSMIESI